jgi:oligopeptidase B
MKPTKPPLPLAKKIAHHSHHHGDTITDPYHWLRDSLWPKVEDAEVIAYLNAENEYYHTLMHPLAHREEAIYKELLGQIKLADENVPIKKDQYYYYTRTNQDSNYPIFCRKFESLSNPEEIILDINDLAKGNEFFSYNTISISPDHQKIAYSTDTTGAERNIIYIKDLTNNTLLNDRIFEVIDNIVWHEHGEGFFYCKLNQYWRPDQVYYHQLNTPAENDTLIYKEENSKSRLRIYKSASKRFIFIGSYTKENSEIRFIDCNTTSLIPQLFAQHTENHHYFPDHINNEFFILTNDLGRNFRLVKTAINEPNQEYWQEVIPHSPESYLQNVVLYTNYCAVESREYGLEKIRIYAYDNIANPETIKFQYPTYSAIITPTSIDAEGVRITYSSLNVPETTLEYNFLSKSLETLKVKEIPSGYDASLYESERIFADTKDGVKIPISLVYKKSLLKKDGTNPLYLYGYGSYGHGMPASFRPYIIPLLDKGFVYAIAHIRGGDEMGYEWYESAKFLTKKRTFTDFIAVTEYLIQEGYTQKEHIVGVGASAGGLLIGACINERPELYKAAIAHVPFVDMLNTMLDENLPLTQAEFKEWGNPAEENYYHYIKSYSPYDNVKAQKYPALYVTAGISDPRVGYWEPAKWVAKLRDMKTDNNLLFLETNMKGGHAGASGRFGFLQDKAKEYNFIFKVFSISEYWE